MATRTKSGIYSPISLAAVNLIASQCPNAPRLLLAYLALARFTSSTPIGTHVPNTVTGAGDTAISKMMKMRWARATPLIEKLIELGVIERAAKGLFVGTNPARYVMKYRGDINLPHALIDGLGDVTGITRLLRAGEGRPPALVTMALIVLIHCYRLHNMLKSGSISPDAVYSPWVFHAVKPDG